MKLKTEYSIGDTVWRINNNKVFSTKIYGIRFDGTYREDVEPHTFTEVEYNVDLEGTHWVTADKIFKTKEDLLKTI